MKKILLLLIISPLFCFSQHNHDEENHSHEDHSHNNEFAIGLGGHPRTWKFARVSCSLHKRYCIK